MVLGQVMRCPNPLDQCVTFLNVNFCLVQIAQRDIAINNNLSIRISQPPIVFGCVLDVEEYLQRSFDVSDVPELKTEELPHNIEFNVAHSTHAVGDSSVGVCYSFIHVT